MINGIVKTWASLAGLLFMLFLIAQFIAYFNYSEMPTVVSVAMADLLEQANVGPVALLIGFILVIALLDIIIPGLLPKWAIFAPVFIPLFIRLDVSGAADPARRVPAGRLPDERDHAVDGLHPVHRPGRPALPEGRGPGHRDLADDSLHLRRPDHLADLLRSTASRSGSVASSSRSSSSPWRRVC